MIEYYNILQIIKEFNSLNSSEREKILLSALDIMERRKGGKYESIALAMGYIYSVDKAKNSFKCWIKNNTYSKR